MTPNNHTSGGYLKEIPKPHKRYFDDRRRRREVTIHITIYQGIGMHYHVTLSEEDDSIWNISSSEYYEDEVVGWQTARDDDRSKGESISEKFNTPRQAEAFVRKTLRRRFPRKTHKYVYGWTGQSRKWFYKDGD